MKKKNIVLLTISVFLATLLVGAGTYAYWLWTSDVNKNVIFNTLGGIEKYIVYSEGDSSFVGNFQPANTFCESTSTTISFYKKSEVADMNLTATINMDINSIGTNIAASDNVYWVLTKGDNTVTCASGLDSVNIINYGTFNGVTVDSTITLISNLEVTEENQVYTVWIWIDSLGSNLDVLSGETIDTNIWTQIDMLNSEPEAPVLDAGMIPVTISDDGTVTTISKDNSDWYNYSNKEWANVILVNNTSRSLYLNTTGVEVNRDDILAYYVWIPRYKYRIWTTGVSGLGGERTIDIVFENKSDAMKSGTKVGEYITHPAFWWDNDSNSRLDSGELLAGIWVGKFETTPDKGSTCHSTPSDATCNNTTQNPTILPNESSLRYQYIGRQFTTSQNISKSGNIYGISNTLTDAHMMKNSEWGAVAYLSHSQYGINKEVRVNNYSNNNDKYYKTGCGATSDNIYSSSTCSIVYGSGVSEYPQSTTGNITGVFDMSGGAFERVMGNYGNITDSTYIPTLPETKYYNLYSSAQFTGDWGTNLGLCTLQTCGGHALDETAGWYNDYAFFIFSTYPWFIRGVSADHGPYVGSFGVDGSNGNSDSSYSWRSVLVSGFGA